MKNETCKSYKVNIPLLYPYKVKPYFGISMKCKHTIVNLWLGPNSSRRYTYWTNKPLSWCVPHYAKRNFRSPTNSSTLRHRHSNVLQVIIFGHLRTKIPLASQISVWSDLICSPRTVRHRWNHFIFAHMCLHYKADRFSVMITRLLV